MQDLDRELEGMKENVMGLQVWNPDSTSYFQASGDDAYDYASGDDAYDYANGDDPYSYADGLDPYSYGNGEGLAKLQGLFDFVGKNKENIAVVGGAVRGLSSGSAGGECKGLFGGALKRKFGRCQDAPVQDTLVAPKSNTGLYVGIGAGVILIGTIAFLLIRKK